MTLAARLSVAASTHKIEAQQPGRLFDLETTYTTYGYHLTPLIKCTYKANYL